MNEEWGDGFRRGDATIAFECRPKRPEMAANGRTVYRRNPTPYSIRLNDEVIELTAAEARDLSVWLQAFLIRTGPQIQ
jgi:hypothetical protein